MSSYPNDGGPRRGGGDGGPRKRYQGRGRRGGREDEAQNNGRGRGNCDGSVTRDQRRREGSPKKHKKNFDGPVFGFKRLYNFLEGDPNDVVISINKDKEDFKLLLESDDLTGEKLIVVLQVLSEKVCVDVPILRQAQANILTACCSKVFVKKLEDCISKISLGCFLPPRHGKNAGIKEMVVDSSLVKVATNVHQLCKFVLKTMPNNAVDFFSTLIVSALGICSSDSSDLCDEFKTLKQELLDVIEKKKKEEETTKRCRNIFDESAMAEFDEETPPDAISEIDIIPSIDELRRTVQTFLRPNKKSGAYRSSEHYLDVQFRLLREDFVQPLRNGIRTFMKERHEYITGKKKLPLGEIRLYTGVQILKVEKERDTVVYKLQLPETSYKRIKWDKSKRLLVGSLILLTTVDNCLQATTTQYGVVFSRNVKELEKGVVTVTWEGSPPSYDEEEEYLMFESEVYLEAYRYTLQTLQKLELDNFPMKKFIVDAFSQVGMPKYLQDATKLMELELANGSSAYVSPHQLEQWPTGVDLGLDENQFQAYRAALTNEFTIIQGPPGTGKTFLGLKVAEVMLNNCDLWTGPGNENPITVVCYTNHALDQFLEGILKYYEKREIIPDIIRIGGRCKSEALQKFVLREVRYRKRSKLGNLYHSAERSQKEAIDYLENERANGMSEIMELQNVQGIIDFQCLCTWIKLQSEYPKKLWDCFQNFAWLGISDKYLNVPLFREDAVPVVTLWFEVRNFPKAGPKRKNHGDGKLVGLTTAGTANGNLMDGENSEEEDYDVDELQEMRILDDIFLEAETSGRVYTGRHLRYLPYGSVTECERSLKQIQKELAVLKDPTGGKNMNNIDKFKRIRQDKANVLWNRAALLREIFRLYKEQLLDLPDVSKLLINIRTNQSFAYERLSMSLRWALYFKMIEIARQSVAEYVADIEHRRAVAQKELREMIQHGDGKLLKGCKVVGLTTTGAAKYNNLLRMMESKIVIVEEAAEVFESHIVTCITENCQHLILIGDHQQLRPSPTVYNLATKYNLDLSLFERMLNNNLHCHQIKVQHRMRPDISNLITGPIYKELHDHDSVKLYPDVKGVTKNVFFITHTELESGDADSMSKSNTHEAKFIAGLCRHLILQGYDSDKITVLTMYTGQMFLLKKEVFKTCQGVRITCVDNFQGEENDIILLSLVRSNDQGNIGFLKTDNRICVSLSRAKHGLFVIGNMEAMVASKTWAAIKEKLEDQDAIGDSLELECEVHRTRSRVKNHADFLTVAPEGGCSLVCDAMLPCSHKCVRMCHVVDKEHQTYKCREPCLKKCANREHPCRGQCFEKCPPCLVIVEKTLNCELQHKRKVSCYQKVEDIECYEKVEKELRCKHKVDLACKIRIHEYDCKVKVDKVLPCGHTKKEVYCHEDPTLINCKTEVDKKLPCGHEQKEECWKSEDSIKCVTIVSKKFPDCGHEMPIACHKKEGKGSCKNRCTTRLKCGHACTKICHINKDPEHLYYECRKECSRECKDGHKCKSKHNCSKECPPCKSKIMRELPCGHMKELECSIDLETYKCLEVCERLITSCKHKCQNLCSQPCGPCDTLVVKLGPCGHQQKVSCRKYAEKSNCEELVRSRNISACGHGGILVPCKYDELTPDELAKHCQQPCSHKFERSADGGCDHQCGGTCSACFQGRIHMKCQADCGRQLVCGHVCEVKCSAVCPPCRKPCLMKCEHSECTKLCGQPCSDCKEKCSWRCPHKDCSKSCGEMCDRDPCDEPCPKKLKCGHECVGFCGEPCPPLCRLCDKEELTEIFFGNEDDEDARFVFLPECGHTIENQGLEYWLTNMNDGQITSKRCPKCKAAVKFCRRFGNLIRQHYQDVIKVKMRSFGNIKNINQIKAKWIDYLWNQNCEMFLVFPEIFTEIRSFLAYEVEKDGRISLVKKKIDELSMTSMDFTANSVQKASLELLKLRYYQLSSPHYEDVVSLYKKTFEWMLERQPLSRQEIKDFNEELDRIDYYKQLKMRRCLATCNPQNTRAYAVYTNCKKLINSTMPFTVARKEEFRIRLKELDDILKSGLGITDRERQEIVNAMGMSQGHWFKCPNGHIYVITECGGATHESTCNECGARIGGGSHRLRSDNQLATEMDNANQAAWPNMVQQLQRYMY